MKNRAQAGSAGAVWGSAPEDSGGSIRLYVTSSWPLVISLAWSLLVALFLFGIGVTPVLRHLAEVREALPRLSVLANMIPRYWAWSVLAGLSVGLALHGLLECLRLGGARSRPFVGRSWSESQHRPRFETARRKVLRAYLPGAASRVAVVLGYLLLSHWLMVSDYFTTFGLNHASAPIRLLVMGEADVAAGDTMNTLVSLTACLVFLICLIGSAGTLRALRLPRRFMVTGHLLLGLGLFSCVPLGLAEWVATGTNAPAVRALRTDDPLVAAILDGGPAGRDAARTWMVTHYSAGPSRGLEDKIWRHDTVGTSVEGMKVSVLLPRTRQLSPRGPCLMLRPGGPSPRTWLVEVSHQSDDPLVLSADESERAESMEGLRQMDVAGWRVVLKVDARVKGKKLFGIMRTLYEEGVGEICFAVRPYGYGSGVLALNASFEPPPEPLERFALTFEEKVSGRVLVSRYRPPRPRSEDSPTFIPDNRTWERLDRGLTPSADSPVGGHALLSWSDANRAQFIVTALERAAAAGVESVYLSLDGSVFRPAPLSIRSEHGDEEALFYLDLRIR